MSKALDIKYRGVAFKAFLRSKTRDSAQWLVETLGGRHFSIRKTRGTKGRLWESDEPINELLIEKLGRVLDEVG